MLRCVSGTAHPEHASSERNRLALHWTPKGAPALLNAGCAWGYGTRFFAARAQHVAGIDVNADWIEVARERYPQIDFRTASLEAIPYPDAAFDVVVCLDVLEHVADEQRSLEEVFRVLRPGGGQILTTPHRGAFAFLDLENVLLGLGRTDYRRIRVCRRASNAPCSRTAMTAIEIDYLIPYGPLVLHRAQDPQALTTSRRRPSGGRRARTRRGRRRGLDRCRRPRSRSGGP